MVSYGLSLSFDSLGSSAAILPLSSLLQVQYIPRNMHTVFALLCFVVVIHWLIFPYPSGLLHWHCGNLTIAPVPSKQLWWIWINTSCEFIMNDRITTTKQSTTTLCAHFLGYTVSALSSLLQVMACSLFGTKILAKQCALMCDDWTHFIANMCHKHSIIRWTIKYHCGLTHDLRISPRPEAKPMNEIHMSLPRPQGQKLRYQFLFYHDTTKSMTDKQLLWRFTESLVTM